MNTISRIGILATLLLASCVQGPWSFWPKDPPVYRGIWVYAHVIAGHSLKEVCFDPIIPLTQTATLDFPFYYSADVKISGTFSGSTKTLTLSPREDHPNCFDGPANEIPAKSKDYQLRAEFDWDSSGTRVTTLLTATTHTPTQFDLKNARVLASSKLDTVFRNDSIVDLLVNLYGEDFRTVLADPYLADSIAGANQIQIVKFLEGFTVPLHDGDTISYLNPPNDLTSPIKLGNKRSTDVKGVLVTQYYDTDGASGLSSFDFIGSQPEPDSADRTDFGHRHRLWFLQDFQNEQDGTNLLDTISVSNAYLYIGMNTIYFYATPKEYADYLSTAVEGADDSRVKAQTNIEGGYGIFAGLAVDSIHIYVKALPGTRTYPFPRTRWLACRKSGKWEDTTECRQLLPKFCADSLSISPECRAYAVTVAIDSGFSWDSLMVPTSDTAITRIVREEGEERWCMQNNYPTSESICNAPNQRCLQSSESNDCKTRLWHWCEDQGWPIDGLSQCGNALASWFRLQNIESPIIERALDAWCNQHSSDPQCKNL